MRRLTLETFVDLDFFVTERHFGGNALFTRNTTNGVPDPNFSDATNELDVQYIRYPAGQPDVAYADGVIVNGYLPLHLVNFLESARTNGQKVLIVTPTHEAYPGAAAIGEFSGLIARDFADVLHAFEIGNEYWNYQNETAYGLIANESVLQVAEALKEIGVNVPIWVQMGDAAGWKSNFHSSNDSRDWVTRTIEANREIIDQISNEAFLEIDGVVEHFYLRGGEKYINIAAPNDQMIELDYAIWKNYLIDEATLNITEWNVRSSNLDQLGIRAASSIIAHFSHIMDLGVDEAYVWPPHLNTSSDLAGSGEVIVDHSTGIVINSVGGAIFDMMSTNLPGLEYLPSGLDNESAFVLHHLYASDNQAVVYLSSRSEVVETVSYNLGEFFDGFVLTSAVRLGYDDTTSDGRHFNYKTRSWDQSQTIQVLGEDYVINEHDVRAEIDVLDHTKTHISGDFTFELLPYQVVELIFQMPKIGPIEGTDISDVLHGTSFSEVFYLRNGNDSITAGGGSDTVYGGGGGDFINSGSGSDVVYAGDGNDSLRGWGGDDTLFGGAGNDDIKGSFGRDFLIGGFGNDSLFGGSGHDTLEGGLGDDFLWGAEGNDLLMSTNGNDLVNGGSGKDTLSFAEAFEGVSIWAGEGIVETGPSLVSFSEIELVEGTKFSDRFTIKVDDMEFVGGRGNDEFSILYGTGNSIFTGADDDLIFIYSEVQQNNVFAGHGDDFIFIYQGAEENLISGGAGNDKIMSHGWKNTYNGGSGNDEFHLFGYGADILIFGVGDGHDTVHGFDTYHDKLYIDKGMETVLSVHGYAGSTLLTFAEGGSIRLEDITLFDMSESIIFV